ncbi:putative exporter of polyketide antibiotics [Paenibacillus forsythiae]|uniref:Exporter of polyketide antibiotics n=1 Tax=Paenibacillus forsythiae TaxID=365616 RepID=A0ABU3H9H0_9BACL|nr:putative exporter of polyketide antibiotics [Paenibacillus forsythiae]
MDKYVSWMAVLRMLSGSAEIIAALIMLRLNQVDKALAVNSGLALVGPTVLILTTAIGLTGMAQDLSPGKLAWVGIGVACLLIGILKK